MAHKVSTQPKAKASAKTSQPPRAGNLAGPVNHRGLKTWSRKAAEPASHPGPENLVNKCKQTRTSRLLKAGQPGQSVVATSQATLHQTEPVTDKGDQPVTFPAQVQCRAVKVRLSQPQWSSQSARVHKYYQRFTNTTRGSLSGDLRLTKSAETRSTNLGRQAGAH